MTRVTHFEFERSNTCREKFWLLVCFTGMLMSTGRLVYIITSKLQFGWLFRSPLAWGRGILWRPHFRPHNLFSGTISSFCLLLWHGRMNENWTNFWFLLRNLHQRGTQGEAQIEPGIVPLRKVWVAVAVAGWLQIGGGASLQHCRSDSDCRISLDSLVAQGRACPLSIISHREMKT